MDLAKVNMITIRFRYAFINDRFETLPGKTGNRYEGAVFPTVYLFGNETYLRFNLRYSQKDARDIHWDYQGPGGGLLLDANLVQKLYGTMAFDYEYQDYVFHPDHRKDQKTTALASLYYRFTRNWKASVDFAYYQTDSTIKIYTYRRSVVGISGEYAF